MPLENGRFDKNVEYQGKEFRVTSRYEDTPGDGESRIIDIFDSEGLYGFVEINPVNDLESAEAYLNKPGEEGLQEVDPDRFREIYDQLSGFERSWDSELELEDPTSTNF